MTIGKRQREVFELLLGEVEYMNIKTNLSNKYDTAAGLTELCKRLVEIANHKNTVWNRREVSFVKAFTLAVKGGQGKYINGVLNDYREFINRDKLHYSNIIYTSVNYAETNALRECAQQIIASYLEHVVKKLADENYDEYIGYKLIYQILKNVTIDKPAFTLKSRSGYTVERNNYMTQYNMADEKDWHNFLRAEGKIPEYYSLEYNTRKQYMQR